MELSPGLSSPLGESGKAFLSTSVGIVSRMGLSALVAAADTQEPVVSQQALAVLVPDCGHEESSSAVVVHWPVYCHVVVM